MRFKNEHLGLAIGSGMLVLGTIANGGLNTKEATIRAELIRDTQAVYNQEVDQIQLQQQHLETLEKIAINRYQSGCLFVVALSDSNTAVSIIEGEPVVDFASRAPIPDKTVVCGFNGTTAVIDGGVVSSVAFTGNQEVIDTAKLRAGFELSGNTAQYKKQ